MKKSESTRLTILQKAFELIYRNGYLNTSIDDIIATTEVTKGAFYYHFKSKDEMGLAIINEMLKPTLENSFIVPLQKEADPTVSIYNLMHELLMENEFLQVAYGCPASNFTQEMAPWNTAFSKALEELTKKWNEVIIDILKKGKKTGTIRKNVYPEQVASFILSGYWGIRNFGKLENSKKAYIPYLKELKNYLNSLR